MATNAALKIALDEDVQLLFFASRVMVCMAMECVNNEHGECQLKKVRINENHGCMEYHSDYPDGEH